MRLGEDVCHELLEDVWGCDIFNRCFERASIVCTMCYDMIPEE